MLVQSAIFGASQFGLIFACYLFANLLLGGRAFFVRGLALSVLLPPLFFMERWLTVPVPILSLFIYFALWAMGLQAIAIFSNSVTLQMLTRLLGSQDKTWTSSEMVEAFSDGGIRTRLESIQRQKLAVNVDGQFMLTRRGRILVFPFLLFRRVLNLGKSG